jgi:hypothetical protein
MATKKNTTLVPQEQSGYLALANADIGELIREELDGLKLSFDKVKIPSGGGLTFEIPARTAEPLLSRNSAPSFCCNTR